MTLASGTRLTGTFLDRIVAARRERLARDRVERPEAWLRERARALPAPLDFPRQLRRGTGATPDDARVRLIAEIKRASPSKGLFDREIDAAELAGRYARAGAAPCRSSPSPTSLRAASGISRRCTESSGPSRSGRPAPQGVHLGPLPAP